MLKKTALLPIIIINALFPFALMPILTHLLSQEQFGTLVLVETFLLILIPVMNFPLAGLMVEYFKLEKEEFKLYLFNTLILTLPVLVLLELLIYLFYDFLTIYINISYQWMFLIPILLALNVITQAKVTIYQAKKQYAKFAFFLIGPNVIVLTATLIILLVFKGGWESKLVAISLSHLTYAFISMIVLHKNNEATYIPSKSMSMRNLSFTVVLIPHTLSAVLYFLADRILIVNIIGNEMLAIYAAGMQFALVISVLQNALSKTWDPYVFEYLKSGQDENREDLYHGLFKKMLITGFVFFGVCVSYAGVLYLSFQYIMPIEYKSSLTVSLLLVLAFCILGFYKIISPILWFHKKANLLSRVTVVIFFVNISLNLCLIPEYGVVGASVATIASTTLQFLCTLYLVYRLDMNEDDSRISQ